MAKTAAKKHFENGLNYFQERNYEQAKDCFFDAIREAPEFSEALYNLAACLAVEGAREDALIYLDRAIENDPDCAKWAKEDAEFETLQEDIHFQRILAGENQFVDEQSLPEDEANGTDPVEQKKDPTRCAACGGKINTVKKPRYSPLLTIGLFLSGLIMLMMSVLTLFGFLLGAPALIYGLILFAQVKEVEKCVACGVEREKSNPAENGAASPASESAEVEKAM